MAAMWQLGLGACGARGRHPSVQGFAAACICRRTFLPASFPQQRDISAWGSDRGSFRNHTAAMARLTFALCLLALMTAPLAAAGKPIASLLPASLLGAAVRSRWAGFVRAVPAQGAKQGGAGVAAAPVRNAV